MATAWLALVVGNTRLHWGFFDQERLVGTWHTPPLPAEIVSQLIEHGFQAEAWQQVDGLTLLAESGLPQMALLPSALWIASVVPAQTALWASDPSVQTVRRSHIPLANLYPTLGVDRAINLLGAGSTVGWPVLVVDGGTALTFTAGISQAGQLAVYGGAILPGIRLQEQALTQKTAALAEAIAFSQSRSEAADSQKMTSAVTSALPAILPERWATDTAGAIASGLAYGAIAAVTDYLTDWWQQFPQGKVVFTGGDAPLLYTLLQQKTPEIASRVQVDSHLMFLGMQVYRQTVMAASTATAQY